MNLQNYRQRLERLRGERDMQCRQRDSAAKALTTAERVLTNTEDAQRILQLVAQQTQQELEYHVSELVTLALSAVFDDPYEFAIDFEIKRGKTECGLSFIRHEESMNPLDASGGGPVDVTGFALRVSLWALERPRIRPTIVLDEPFKHLSRNLQPRACEMLKQLSAKLGLQFIMITHSAALIEAADKVFEVDMVQRDGWWVSRVMEATNETHNNN